MEHNHNHNEPHSHDELVAMTKYLISHNSSHISELVSLCEKVESEQAKAEIQKAINDFQLGCDSLNKALEIITGE